MPRPRELSLIEALRRRLPPPREDVVLGIGDDATIVRSRPICLTSVDAVVEGVHFQLGKGRFSHRDVGFKALAAALSDLAAMGVGPRRRPEAGSCSCASESPQRNPNPLSREGAHKHADPISHAGEAYLVLGVPPGTTEEQALQVGEGASELASAFQVSIAGGDVVSSPILSVSVTVNGWSESASALIRRSGAMPGDLIGVTGTLGGAACGLAVMQGEAEGLDKGAADAALARARAPQPRLSEGAALSAAGAGAMIDVSDGLATDAAHIGLASKLTLEIDLSLLPLHRAVSQVAKRLQVEPWRLAATGGEDYELCVCISPSQRSKAERSIAAAGGAGIAWIGEAVEGPPGARFTIDGAAIELRGFEHRW